MPLSGGREGFKNKDESEDLPKMRFEAFGETKANKKQCVQAMDCFFFLFPKADDYKAAT